MLGTAQARGAQEVAASTANVELDSPTHQSADLVEHTIREGREAWERIQNKQRWEDWLAVGKANVVGRAEAMQEARVNKPKGRRYNSAFTPWQYKHGFENLDKADRCRLFEVMDHLPEIEAWRQTLTPRERAGLNHPSTVLRRWKATKTKGTAQNVERNRPEPEQTNPGPLNPLAWANASLTERAAFISAIGWQTIGEAIPADWRPAIEEWLHPKPAPVIIDRDGHPISEDDLSIPAFLKVVSPSNQAVKEGGEMS
jgi:hypothetical protein